MTQTASIDGRPHEACSREFPHGSPALRGRLIPGRLVLEGQHLAGSVTSLGWPYPIFFLPLVLGLTVMHLWNEV